MKAAFSKKTVFKVLRYILVLPALGMIVYILANTDFRLIWLHLREVPLPLAALLLSLQLVTQMALNLQWYLLSRNLNLKTSFLPTLGDPIKSILLSASKIPLSSNISWQDKLVSPFHLNFFCYVLSNGYFASGQGN
jgi:hypothetical protein